MSQKTCRHCDIVFMRPDDCPIPHDRCEECHWEIEAMKTPLCADGRPCGQQDHPDDDAYCHKCPHEPKRGTADVALGQSSGVGFGIPSTEDIDRRLKLLGRSAAPPVYGPADVAFRSKYHREIKPGVWVDVYDVIQAFGVTNGALQHLIKKALAAGQRGHKTLDQDLDDIIASAKRAKELEQ